MKYLSFFNINNSQKNKNKSFVTLTWLSIMDPWIICPFQAIFLPAHVLLFGLKFDPYGTKNTVLFSICFGFLTNWVCLLLTCTSTFTIEDWLCFWLCFDKLCWGAGITLPFWALAIDPLATFRCICALYEEPCRWVAFGVVLELPLEYPKWLIFESST